MGWASMVRPTESDADKRRWARCPLLIVERCSRFVERLEQLGEAPVPGGESVSGDSPISTISKMPGMIGMRRYFCPPCGPPAGDRPLDPPAGGGSARPGRRAGARPGQVRGRRPRELPQVPHQGGLFLGEEVLDKATARRRSAAPSATGWTASRRPGGRRPARRGSRSASWAGSFGRGVVGPMTPSVTAITRRGACSAMLTLRPPAQDGPGIDLCGGIGRHRGYTHTRGGNGTPEATISVTPESREPRRET